MDTKEAIQSFLEERPNNDKTEYLENNLCVRFMRKKFKCLIIFFLTICIFCETMLVINEKINFNDLLDRMTRIRNSTHQNNTP